MKLPNPEDCRKSIERRRREALACADSNEWVSSSQIWETIAATSEKPREAQTSRSPNDPSVVIE
jgi:hypothetical protein